MKAFLGAVIVFCATSIIVAVQAPLAQPDHRPSSTSAADALSPAEKAFVTKAAEGGQAEVELAQLALQKAESQAVKALAQRIAEDHQRANQELQIIAEQKAVTLPSTLGKEHAAEKSRLEGLSGAQFDRAYVQQMIKDHRKDIAEFEQISTKAADADVKAFASKTLPTLKEHLAQAESAAKSDSGGR
jgi:putative membrane protein